MHKHHLKFLQKFHIVLHANLKHEMNSLRAKGLAFQITVAAWCNTETSLACPFLHKQNNEKIIIYQNTPNSVGSADDAKGPLLLLER